MEIVTILVSVVSMLVVASVTSYTMVQSGKMKKEMDTTMQSIVDQINTAQYYKYKFDKLQENNIKTLDTNTQNIHDRMAGVRKEMTTARDQLNNRMTAVEGAMLQKKDLVSGVDYIKTGKLRLGDQHLLSGVGDAHSQKPDGWLRFFDKDGKDYHGGIAAGKVWTKDGATLNGTTDVNGTLNIRGGKSEYNPNNLATQFATFKDNKNYIRGDTEVHGGMINMGAVDIRQGLTVKGGVSEHNALNQPTIFSHAQDRKNYIRGDTELRGNTNNIGSLNVGQNMNVQGKMFFGDPTMNAKPVTQNSTDPYFIEKVSSGQNQNALRLTINDDENEAFEIWGNACGTAAGCTGPGALQHYFQANGNAQHMGNMVVGKSLRVGGPVQSGSLQVQPASGDNQLNAWIGAKSGDDVMAIGMNRSIQGIVSQSKKPFGIWDGTGERILFDKGTTRVKSDFIADRLCVGNTCFNEEELKKMKALLR